MQHQIFKETIFPAPIHPRRIAEEASLHIDSQHKIKNMHHLKLRREKTTLHAP